MKTKVLKHSWLLIKLYQKKSKYTNKCTEQSQKTNAQKTCRERSAQRNCIALKFAEYTQKTGQEKSRKKFHRKNAQKIYTQKCTEKVHKKSSQKKCTAKCTEKMHTKNAQKKCRE